MDMECSFIRTSDEKVDCYFDHINYMINFSNTNPYLNIWKKSMLNQKFRNYFINRFADLMNTSFIFNRLSSIANSMYNQTIDEMPKEFNLYKDTSSVSLLMTKFNNNHLEFLLQLSKRTEQVRNHIQSNFSLSGQVDVTLNVVPAGAGKIKINTVFPDSLPWTGVYFNGNPVQITAFPNPGFNFVYWDTNSVLIAQNINQTLNLNIPTDVNFNAVFEPDSFVGKLAITELNFHSDETKDAGDWIEFLNYGNGPIDISGWEFSNSKIYNKYIFPNGTVIQPNERFILADDTIKFNSQHFGVSVLAQINFGFSNSSDFIKLSDYANETKLWMSYNDTLSWVFGADGSGRTLELKNDSLNPSLPENWFIGCIGGSPGTPYMPCNEKIIFSEINYKSLASKDAGDWVELLNISDDDIDISGWKFSNDNNNNMFIIPSGTVIPTSAYMVLFNDLLKFKTQFPSVTNKKGPFNFDIGSSIENIQLFNDSGFLCQSIVYDKNMPWPQGANGLGYTLEILNPNGNLCDGTNWFQGCLNGSPGGPYIYPCGTSINETIYNDYQLNVFPNPSTGIFTIDIKQEFQNIAHAEFELFNIYGNIIYTKSFLIKKYPIEVDFSSFSKGIYFLKIVYSKNTYTAKIIIL